MRLGRIKGSYADHPHRAKWELGGVGARKIGSRHERVELLRDIQNSVTDYKGHKRCSEKRYVNTKP
jgi:hypothetical protein